MGWFSLVVTFQICLAICRPEILEWIEWNPQVFNNLAGDGYWQRNQEMGSPPDWTPPMEASETWDAPRHLCQLYQPKTKFFVIWVGLYGHDTRNIRELDWLFQLDDETHLYQVIQFVPFSSPIVGGHVFTPWKGHVFTIPKCNELNHQVLGKWLEITISIHWEVTLAFRFQGAWTPRGEFQILHFFGSPFREPRKALLIEKFENRPFYPVVWRKHCLKMENRKMILFHCRHFFVSFV